MVQTGQNSNAVLNRADGTPVSLDKKAQVIAVGNLADEDTEPLQRRPLSAPEATVVIAFLAVGATLLLLGQSVGVILGLLAGIAAVAVAVLARRVPKFTWK